MVDLQSKIVQMSHIINNFKVHQNYREEELLEGMRREGEQLVDKHPEDPLDSALACSGSPPLGSLAVEGRLGTAVDRHSS